MLTYVAIGLIAIAVLGILALLIYYRIKQKKYMKNAVLFNSFYFAAVVIIQKLC